MSEDIATRTQAAVMNRLERVHHVPLTTEDRQGISQAYRTLYSGGPLIKGDYGGGAWIPSYADLVAATDLAGRNWGFLATEDVFGVVQAYQRRNLAPLPQRPRTFFPTGSILRCASMLSNPEASPSPKRRSGQDVPSPVKLSVSGSEMCCQCFGSRRSG